MRREESIVIEDLGTSMEEIINLFESENIFFRKKFEDAPWDTCIEYKGEYDKTFYSRFLKIVDESKISNKIRHVVFPFYDQEDYDEAPFIALAFEEKFINNFRNGNPTRVVKCLLCNQSTTIFDFSKRCPSFKTKSHIITINGRFEIISRFLKDQIKLEGLKGGVFNPFDDDETFFYLSCRHSMKNRIILDDEVFDYKGICSKCGNPLARMFSGPLRYHIKDWNGDDFIWSVFHKQIVFSKNAFKLINSISKRITKLCPVFFH